MRDDAKVALPTLAAVILTVGCSADAGVIPAEVGDSAGVRIVTYDLTGVDVPTYRVVGEPDLHIGTLDGAPEYVFSRIADLALTDDGSILVSDAVAQELRLYDATGAYVRTIGQGGEGPGEFAMAPTVAGTSGDTVFAFDARSDRLTTLLITGELIRTLTLRSETIGRPDVVIRQDDGSYLSQSDWTGPSGVIEFYDMRLDLDSIVIERLDPDGALVDTVRVMADRTRARRVQNRGGGVMSVMQAPTPYSAQAFVGSDGVRPILGRSDRFELNLLGASGEHRTVLRVLGVEHPATAADIRAHQEARLREDLGDGEIDPMVRRLNIEYLPERLPSFGNVLVSEEGDVWVSLTEYDLSAGLDWLVFTAAGALRGIVHTPPDLHLRAVRGDLLVGFVLDELDVPYVRRYRLPAEEASGSP